MGLANISLAEGVGLVRRGNTSDRNATKDEEAEAGDLMSEGEGIAPYGEQSTGVPSKGVPSSLEAPNGLACSISNILLSFVHNRCCHQEARMSCFMPG